MEKARKSRVKKEDIGYSRESIFPTRLRELLDERGVTQEALASELGIARQSVAQWKDGKTMPDIYYLKGIAEYFEVSADWLVGLTNDSKRNPSAVDALGLSEKSLGNITLITGIATGWDKTKDYSTGDEFTFTLEPKEILNLFLSNERLLHLVFAIKNTVDERASCQDIRNMLKEDSARLSSDEELSSRAEYNTWRAINYVTKMVEETIEKYYENTKEGISTFSTKLENKHMKDGDTNADTEE